MAKPTIPELQKMKADGKKISMVTAYDFALMSQVDKTEIEMVLVGDSAAMVMLGYDGTQPITMDEMLIFSRAVSLAARNTFVVGDMPFMSYEISSEKAVENAGRLMKEGHVDAVKLEGGVRVAETVKRIVNAGIPVMGHIGLTPQTASMLGGFKVQGVNLEAAKAVVEDALAIQEAGAFAVVMEAIPAPVARLITDLLKIPTVGIGAGLDCDGQVLVLHDLLGLFDRFTPKFVKRYAEMGTDVQNALTGFVEEVRGGVFPAKEHTFSMNSDLATELESLFKEGVDR